MQAPPFARIHALEFSGKPHLNQRSTPPLVTAQDVQGIDGLFTDVDDTLTKDGKLSAPTYEALWRLRQAGIAVVPVTGRSYGWAHMMLSQWPVDAVIAESGGVYLHRKAKATSAHGLESAEHPPLSSPLKIVFFEDLSSVQANRLQLLKECARIISNYPELRFASDNALRQVDVAIDYCEDIPAVPMSTVEAVVDELRRAGFQARHSTVHINAWHGSFDKGPMAMRYLQEIKSVNGDAARTRWAFIGDAPNDRTMFSLFPKSIAVANIQPFLESMEVDRPAWLTRASHGEGFVELANLLLHARRLSEP
jgi:hydroxymethylpyrimidine pyrophosphatase-like HAD family hydrolase